MTPQTFIFIGRYGSGKGTQAKLMVKTLKKLDPNRKVIYVETGAGLRKVVERSNNYTAELTKKVIDSGGLMPGFMPVYIWSNILVDNFTGNENLVFDGTSRVLIEAKILDQIFPFYGLEKPWVVCLDLDHKDSVKRISLRSSQSGRADDNTEAIEKRKKAFEKDVAPVIEWYRTNPNVRFLEIDGNRSVEEIHEDIVKRVGLK